MPLLSADPTAFPIEPPADIHHPAAIAEHDWAAFCALEEMADHWARPGWTDGARAYYWMLVFPDEPELRSLALNCQESLVPLGLDPVPADGLHITLARVGSPNTVTPAQLDDLLMVAEPVLPGSFSIRAIPLAGSRGAVRLSLGPWEPLLRLHAALVQAGRATGLGPTKPTAVFRPHLSLAYNNRPRPAAPVVETVAGLRSLPNVEIQVRGVQLVELRRERRAYYWDVLKSLPLA